MCGLSARFWAIVREEVRKRVEHCLPCEPPPERPGRAMLAGKTFTPFTTTLEEFFALAQTISDIHIRGDVAGYVSDGSVVIMNSATPPAPMNPQPAANTLQVSQSGLSNFYLTADARVVIVGDDAMADATAWTAAVSAVETGTDDDLTLSGVYDPDVAGAVDGASLGAFTPVASAADLPPPA